MRVYVNNHFFDENKIHSLKKSTKANLYSLMFVCVCGEREKLTDKQVETGMGKYTFLSNAHATQTKNDTGNSIQSYIFNCRRVSSFINNHN